MTTPNPHDHTDQLRADLRAALQRITTLEARLEELEGRADTTLPTATDHVEEPAPPDRQTTFDRRRLLTRGGTAAVGAVLGGAAATIATARPAAAATGTFDTTDATPAMSASTAGSGAAVEAATSASGAALHTIGRSQMDGRVSIALQASSAAAALDIEATGPNTGGIGVKSDSSGALIHAQKTALFAIGDPAVLATGGKLGLLAAGTNAQVVLMRDETYFPMPPPLTRDDPHEAGEVYFDVDGCLWLCLADGAPGTWTRLGGAGTTGALTMLASPVRVYDSRTGYPPSVGPKTPLAPGVDRVIDCTANTSGLPTDATAAIVTITIANPTGPGWLAARANGAPYTGTSTLNWTAPGAVVATTTTTALGPQATIALRTMTTTDAIVDVIGYHR